MSTHGGLVRAAKSELNHCADGKIGVVHGLTLGRDDGMPVVVDETFQTAELDPAKWAVRAQDAGGVFPISADLAYLVSWNLPDTGFVLNAGAKVTGPWSVVGTPQLVGARRVVQVMKAALPSAGAGFFRLVK